MTADLPDRFAATVADGDDLPLDLACLLVAEAVDPAVDVDAELARLDALATQVDAPDLDGVVRLLFGVEGFEGDEDDYYDPANSLLPRVLDRRRGIPITLTVVAMEVARRVGVPATGIGMPGHFLLGDPLRTDVFVDPFSGGVLLDRRSCRRVFEQLHGDRAAWTDEFLDPVGHLAIVRRVLNNLSQIGRVRGERHLLASVVELQCRLPDATTSDRLDLAKALAAVGRFSAAAGLLEGAIDDAPPEAVDDLRRAARYLRARLN
jgi:regulator of sirC expression with transglutaminase-like and TPR domain